MVKTSPLILGLWRNCRSAVSVGTEHEVHNDTLRFISPVGLDQAELGPTILKAG